MRHRHRSWPLLLLIPALLLAGCWDRREIEDMGFVMALGLDKGKGGNVVVTVQVAVPRALVGTGGGGGGQAAGGVPPVVVERVEQKTVIEALRDLETFTNRRISLVHLRLVVFGRDLASAGLQNHLGILIRNREIRETIQVMVAQGTAEDILRLHPAMERDPSLFLEDLTRRARDRTARAPRVNFHRFLTTYETLGEEPVLPLVHPRTTRPGLTDTPPDTKSRLEGTAVFRRDRMVCELSAEESETLMMLTRGSRSFVQNIPAPGLPGHKLAVELTAESIRVQLGLSGTEPVFTMNVVTEGDLRETEQTPPERMTPEGIDRLGREVESLLTDRSRKLIDRLQQECKADVLGLGKHLQIRFIDFPAWKAYDWPSHFAKARINVTVQTKIRRVGMTLQSAAPP
jgi:spore germination protein KC